MKTVYYDGNEVYLDKLVTGKEAVLSNLRARLSIMRGEFKPNIYLGLVLGSTEEEFDLFIKQIILTTEGVKNILRFESKMEGNNYVCNFKVNTDFGEVEYE